MEQEKKKKGIEGENEDEEEEERRRKKKLPREFIFMCMARVGRVPTRRRNLKGTGAPSQQRALDI